MILAIVIFVGKFMENQPSYEEWLDEIFIIQDVLKDIIDKKINYYSFLQRPIDTFGILRCQYSIK